MRKSLPSSVTAEHWRFPAYRLQWAAVAIWMVLTAVIGFRLRGAATDDIYITYRYAADFATGRGLVFNPGEHVFGVSDPGVAVLLGCLRFLGAPVPLLGTFLSGLALLTIATVVSLALKEFGREPEGLVAAGCIVSSPYLWLGQGAGPLMSLALVLLASRVLGRRPMVAALLAAAAVGCRPDAFLAALVLCILAARGERAKAVAFATTLALGLGVVAGGLWLAFGTWLPNTLLAKRLFAGQAPGNFRGAAFWTAALTTGSDLYGSVWWIMILASVPGLVLLLRGSATELRVLGASAVLFIGLYSVVGVPFFVWYATYPVVAVLVGTPLAAGAAIRYLEARLATPRLRLGVACGAFAAALLVSSAIAWHSFTWWREGPIDWRLRAYRWAGEWIRGHSAPEDWIAYDEIGILGYFSDRPILDLVGLVTPSSLPYTAVGDTLGAFLHQPTRFVVQHSYDQRGGTRPITARPWFPAAYREVARWSDPLGSGGMLVYERINPTAIPAARPPVPRWHPRDQPPLRGTKVMSVNRAQPDPCRFEVLTLATRGSVPVG